MRRLLLALLLVVVFNSYADNLTRTISVEGYGEIKIEPDTVVIATGVDSSDPIIGMALEKNSITMANIFDGLSEVGINKDAIETSNYNVYLHRPFGEGEVKEEYRVSNSIRIKIKNLELVDVIIDLLVTLGANKINGVYFTFEEESRYTTELQKMAMENAREKAEFLASLEDMVVKGVISISEDNSSSKDEPRNYEFVMASPMKTSSIDAGLETLSLSYHVVYELGVK